MSGTTARPPPPEIWLDHLPEELCDRIAEHVTEGIQDHAALNLAAISRKQMHSVARSLPRPSFINLRNRFGFFRHDEIISRWEKVFAEDPFEITLSVKETTPLALQLLRESNVVEVQTRPESGDIFSMLPQSHSLRRLFLEISPLTDMDRVVELISSLTLEELVFNEGDPLFDDLTVFADACIPCMKACSSSTRFNWHDRNYTHSVARSYWNALKMLPESMEMTLTAPPPENMFTKLSQFRSVEVVGLSPDIARRIGSCVSLYWSCDRDDSSSTVVEANDLLQLVACTRLRNLKLRVPENAGNAMIELVSQLPSLGYLTVLWTKNCDDASAKPRHNVMLNIVRACPRLESLRIENGEVSGTEWEQIVAHAGGELTSLFISNEMGKSELCELLLKVLSSISRYCKKLDTFLVSTNNMKQGWEVPKEQVDKVLHVARRLQMARPTLAGGRLEMDIYDLLHEGEEDSGIEDEESEAEEGSETDDEDNHEVDNDSD